MYDSSLSRSEQTLRVPCKRCETPSGCAEDDVHELIVVDLDPPILYPITQKPRWSIGNQGCEMERRKLTLSVSTFWNASVNCLITTQALTNRSKVIPTAWAAGGGWLPYPGTLGAGFVEAALNMSSPEEDKISDDRLHRAYGLAEARVRALPYFFSTRLRS